LEEADLSNLHTRVERHGKVGEIGEFERDVAIPTSVDKTGR
jgi:hypothetical protein